MEDKVLIPIDRKKDIWMEVKAPLKERGSLYGDPKDNLFWTFFLQEVYRRASIGNIDCVLEDTEVKITKGTQRLAAHNTSINMVLLKIARIATGKFCEDNYIDAIGYLEIARKLAKGEDTSPEKI